MVATASQLSGVQWLPYHVHRGRTAFGAHLTTSTLVKNIRLAITHCTAASSAPAAAGSASSGGAKSKPKADADGESDTGRLMAVDPSLLHRLATALVQFVMAQPETQCLKRVLTTKVSSDGLIDFVIILLPKKLQPFIDSLTPGAAASLTPDSAAPTVSVSTPVQSATPLPASAGGAATASAADTKRSDANSLALPQQSLASFAFRPVGILRSCFSEKYGTPVCILCIPAKLDTTILTGCVCCL